MRCRQAEKLLGPYMDGELAIADSKRLEKHLESCEGCAEQLAFLRGMTREISALPAIVPTAEESLQLRKRVREEMANHRAPKPFYRRVQVAAAASLLLIATGVGVTWAVLSSGTTQPGGEVTVSQPEQPSDEEIVGGAEMFAEEAPATTAAPTMVASAVPQVSTTGQQYSAAELSDYDNDLDARLDFYSAYWHPISAAEAQDASMEPLQDSLKEDMARKAAAAGQDPEALEGAVDSALSQSGRENLLPCYAELARLNGNRVWLICLSGPEDYLLFNNPEMVPAMSIASIFGQEGMNNRKVLIDELARQLFPYYTGSPSTVAITTSTNAGALEAQQAPLEDGEEPPAAVMDEREAAASEDEVSQEEQEFQDFLRRIVTRGNVMDLLSVLEGLDYEQLLMIIQGSWKSLGGGRLDLGEFLVPPKRIWAVDVPTGEVLYQP
jgi:hypothetical protein